MQLGSLSQGKDLPKRNKRQISSLRSSLHLSRVIFCKHSICPWVLLSSLLLLPLPPPSLPLLFTTNHSCIFTSSNNSIISYSEISKPSCVSSLYSNKVLLIFLLIYLEFLPFLSQNNDVNLGPLYIFCWMMNASISSPCATDPSQYQYLFSKDTNLILLLTCLKTLINT